ncbi:PD40 domain-containing protein [bacterium]|nr:PD40 domain-containing protein [bacterium]
MRRIHQFQMLFNTGLSVFLLMNAACGPGGPADSTPIGRQPRIDPDYSDTVIPPNIAPMNFTVGETGREYRVEIASEKGDAIVIRSRHPGIRIPMKDWKRLLARNTGQALEFRIMIRQADDRWTGFDPIVNFISAEPIDPCLVYRLLPPMYYFWGEMRLAQRNLENFEEKPILMNRVIDKSCMNCHTFCAQDPGSMIMHVRGGKAAGMYLWDADRAVKIDTRTPFFPGAAVYPSWHPDGRIIAFSLNRLSQYFHAAGESREVVDLDSDLILYRIDDNSITTCPQIACPDNLETFPSWSPDGRFLYFSTAVKQHPMDHNSVILYDVARIPFDPESGSWGNAETIVSASDLKRSALLPRISPDGRFLLFCALDHGNFPAFDESGDLFMMDLADRSVRELTTVNSRHCESYHAWSGSGRWIVFSSKQRDNTCALPYFSHVDGNGTVSKSFVLPQKDPGHYTNFLMSYNLPELLSGPVTVRSRSLVEAASGEAKAAVLDPDVAVPPRDTENGRNTTPIPL